MYREQTPESGGLHAVFPQDTPLERQQKKGVLGHDYHQSPQLLVPSREFRKSLGDWEVASSQPGL